LTGRSTPTLQVMAERADGSSATMDDCVAITRALGPVLEVADPIAGAYRLEVSSAGIDRPLVRARDFTRFAGQRCEVVARAPIEGRRRFKGRLKGLDGAVVVLESEDGAYRVPLEAVAEARLMVSDDVLTAAPKPRGRERS
jgi:ribosome maturation factor RimP